MGNTVMMQMRGHSCDKCRLMWTSPVIAVNAPEVPDMEERVAHCPECGRPATTSGPRRLRPYPLIGKEGRSFPPAITMQRMDSTYTMRGTLVIEVEATDLMQARVEAGRIVEEGIAAMGTGRIADVDVERRPGPSYTPGKQTA